MKQKSILCLVLGLCLFAFPAHAAVYHIDPDTGSSGNGTANSPFKRWSDLPTMKTGDDVYYKCDTKTDPSSNLRVSWGGTKANPVVIGSYYMNGNDPVYGVKGKRPIISGSNYTIPSNDCFASSDSWQGLIDVSSKDYVQIKNLRLYRSGFIGIFIKGNIKNDTNSAHFLIKNVKIEGSYWQGILVDKNPYNYGIIEDSEVTGAAYAWDQGCTRGFTGAMTITNTPYAHTTIRRNYVHENWGEGIGSNRIPCSSETDHSGYTTIEDNVVWNNRRVDIYSDRTEHNTIRRNMLLGTTDREFKSASSNDRTWNQWGIWINVEHADGRGACPDSSHDNSVYNNMVAGHNRGIGLATDYTSGKMSNNIFYNNTSIGNAVNYYLGNKISGYNTSNIVFKNNVSYCPPGTICKDVADDPSWIDNKITAEYNAWTKKPNNWGSSKDQITNNNWSKVNGWQDLKEIPQVSDFMPSIGNPVIDNGTSLTAQISKAVSMNQTEYQILPIIDISVGTVAQDNKWDMGAVPYQRAVSQLPGQDPNEALKPPTLTIR